MSYQVDIDEDFIRRPEDGVAGSKHIRFQLGVDFEEDIVAYMLLSFILKESNLYELRFGTEEMRLSREGWSRGMDYTPEKSKRFAPKPHRRLVLDLLLRAIEAMMNSVKPHKVSMHTIGPLPSKAMKKYNEISEVMAKLGCTTEHDYGGTNGRHYWLFNRKH